jgi:hypothetical protein
VDLCAKCRPHHAAAGVGLAVRFGAGGIRAVLWAPPQAPIGYGCLTLKIPIRRFEKGKSLRSSLFLLRTRDIAFPAWSLKRRRFYHNAGFLLFLRAPCGPIAFGSERGCDVAAGHENNFALDIASRDLRGSLVGAAVRRLVRLHDRVAGGWVLGLHCVAQFKPTGNCRRPPLSGTPAAAIATGELCGETRLALLALVTFAVPAAAADRYMQCQVGA